MYALADESSALARGLRDVFPLCKVYYCTYHLRETFCRNFNTSKIFTSREEWRTVKGLTPRLCGEESTVNVAGWLCKILYAETRENFILMKDLLFVGRRGAAGITVGCGP